jgi:putative transposase
MDWATRKVLAWRVSNSMEVEFCLEVLEEAMARFERPEIFNTDSKYAPASCSYGA